MSELKKLCLFCRSEVLESGCENKDCVYHDYYVPEKYPDEEDYSILMISDEMYMSIDRRVYDCDGCAARRNGYLWFKKCYEGCDIPVKKLWKWLVDDAGCVVPFIADLIACDSGITIAYKTGDFDDTDKKWRSDDLRAEKLLNQRMSKKRKG